MEKTVEMTRLKAVTAWEIELLDKGTRSTGEFYVDYFLQRCTQKDIDEEWCIIDSEMEKKVFFKHEVPGETRKKEQFARTENAGCQSKKEEALRWK